MTDERIDKLLGCFGQTIADLPKPIVDAERGTQWAYPDNKNNIIRTALRWNQEEWILDFPHNSISEDGVDRFMCEYAQHLADIIDRMEAALETAKNWINCPNCVSYGNPECNCPEDAGLNDETLSDSYLSDEEVEEIMKGRWPE